MRTLLLKSLNGVLLIASVVLLVECKKEEEAVPKPTAHFSHYPSTNLVAPVTVNFTNESKNADSYVWSYDGTGRTLTSADIALVFNEASTYIITLTATGKGGTDTYTKTITVSAPPTTKPIAGFTYSPSQNLVAPAKIAFTNISTNANSYNWDFGDGTASTTASPTKEFTKAGTYKVKLTATGKNESNSFTADITISAAATTTQPVADFSYSPSSNLTAPIKITFSNASKNADSYNWDFGDGSTSTVASPTKEFTKAGDFVVKLTATDSKKQSAQKSVTISVKAATVVPTADYTWSASNLKVTFTNTSKNANSYQWNFGDGTTSTSTNPTHDYAKAGTYNVSLKASDGKNEDQDIKLVTVTAPATATCDWAAWGKFLEVKSYKYTAGDAYCKVNKGYDGSTRVYVINNSNVIFNIKKCLKRPDGTWDCAIHTIGAGGEDWWYTCGQAKGYWIIGRPSTMSTACPFPEPQ
jgi:PKD repeat protein